MKLKKIAALCKRQKTFAIHDQTEKGESVLQWLGNGIAMYQINGLHYLDKDSLCTIFDLTDQQQDKCFFKHTSVLEGINLHDIDPSEILLKTGKISISHAGKVLIPLESGSGILFIQKQHLSPLEDIHERLEMYERRTPQGNPYIVVKTGLLIRAVISPFKIITENFVSDLDTLARGCRRALEERERISSEKEITSTPDDIFHIDPKTGNINVKRVEDIP